MKPQFGLVGRGLSHSFSPGFFEKKFAEEEIDATYELFDFVKLPDLETWAMSLPDLKGFNVTLPYKEEVAAMCDTLSQMAKESGAVNCVLVERLDAGEVMLHGFNTDVPAFAQSIEPFLQDWHTQALVLGTGGASKAVCTALKHLGLRVTVAGRDGQKSNMTFDEINGNTLSRHLVVVNTTPLGQFPDVHMCPQVPFWAFTDRHLAYDLIYNPPETGFLRRAANQGSKTKNGLEMLHKQAELSWDIWQTGVHEEEE